MYLGGRGEESNRLVRTLGTRESLAEAGLTHRGSWAGRSDPHMPIGQEHRAVCGHPSDRPPECTPARDLRIAWPEQARTVLGEMPRGYYVKMHLRMNHSLQSRSIKLKVFFAEGDPATRPPFVSRKGIPAKVSRMVGFCRPGLPAADYRRANADLPDARLG